MPAGRGALHVQFELDEAGIAVLSTRLERLAPGRAA
jgi:hypothetical protein